MSIDGIFNSIKYSDISSSKDATGGSYIRGASNKSVDALPGTQITGKVVSSENGNVKIDVNGNLVNAKLEGNVSLNPGESVTFDVKANNGNQIVLTPLYTNTANISTAIKALSYAGLPVNEQNVSMADSMITNNMKIDSASLTSMHRLATSYPETDPKLLVEMKKMGLDINADNIESFTSFKNYETQITSGMRDIMDSIPGAFNELISRGNDEQFKAFALDVINTLSNPDEGIAIDDGSGNINVLKDSVPGEQPVANLDLTALNINVQDGEIVNNNSNLIDNENAVANVQDKVIINNENLDDNKVILNDEKIKADIINSDSAKDELISDKKAINSAELSEKNEAISDTKSVDGWKSLSTFDKSNIIDALKTAGLNDNISRYLLSENASSKDFFDVTKMLLEKGNLTDKFKEMIASDKFQNLLSTDAEKQWLLNPIDVGQKETVENLYKRLNEQVKQLTESLSGNALENTALSSNLSEMNNNLDFMNQMNNMYQYIQLPLKMAGSEATGDLFVYTDKKSLARNDGNVSALLHLDMDHLGPLDVYASITPGNNVHTRFTLQDESVLSFIESNMHILNERLTKRGYNMKYETTVKVGTATSNVVPSESKKIMNYSFDMKA